MKVRLWPRRAAAVAVPVGLSSQLRTDETLLAGGATTAGEWLGATRFGLWVVEPDGNAQRWGWELISRASLADRTLSVVLAVPMQTWPDGTTVLSDLPPRRFDFAAPTGLTDTVHTRVRASVLASDRLPWPGAGGWVVLRRVPGQDGVARQVRLDPGASADAPGFAAAVAARAGALAPAPIDES